jgi:hypothetical protein
MAGPNCGFAPAPQRQELSGGASPRLARMLTGTGFNIAIGRLSRRPNKIDLTAAQGPLAVEIAEDAAARPTRTPGGAGGNTTGDATTNRTPQAIAKSCGIDPLPMRATPG